MSTEKARIVANDLKVLMEQLEIHIPACRNMRDQDLFCEVVKLYRSHLKRGGR